MTLTLDLTRHQEEILVTASPDARSQREIAQPTSVLAGEELMLQMQPTLGETLNRQPGVTSTFFGPGASRPVIRGLGGDRIRVLEGGLGTGDASTTSPDHAVSVDPLSAERIEVLRGPATLLYGSSAVGGVVNVIDNRVPDTLPGERLTGTVELRGGTVADERGGAANLEGSLGRIAWHVDFLKRETDDYEIPGFAESAALRAEEEEEGEEHEEVRGLAENSATDTEAGAVGFSWVGDDGFLGLAVRQHDSLYGIPGGHAHHHEGEGEEEGEEEEAKIRVDLEQRRWDLRGGVTRPFGIFRGANLRFGTTDYEHRELEGAEIGTRFLNDSWEGRLELLQRQLRPADRLLGRPGPEPRLRGDRRGGLRAADPDGELGGLHLPGDRPGSLAPSVRRPLRDPGRDARTRQTDVDDRSFDGLSGSVGLVWQPTGDDYSIGLSLARSTKLPNAEELFSNGPHLATNAFEIGDPNLEEETSLGFDLTFRKTSGPLTGELNLFVNRFDDFIFESFTDEEEDGLPVFRYIQQDAEFRGAEISGVYELFHTEPYHVDVEFGADYVRAELRELATGEPLPRIPPLRYRLGFHYRGEKLQGLIEGERVEEQDRVAAFERPTEGYTLLNASLGYRFFTDDHGLRRAAAGDQPDGRGGAQPRLLPEGPRAAAGAGCELWRCG